METSTATAPPRSWGPAALLALLAQAVLEVSEAPSRDQAGPPSISPTRRQVFGPAAQSVCRWAFHSASARLWPRGTPNEMAKSCDLHQQSALHPHVYSPAASRDRVIRARTRYPDQGLKLAQGKSAAGPLRPPLQLAFADLGSMVKGRQMTRASSAELAQPAMSPPSGFHDSLLNQKDSHLAYSSMHGTLSVPS